MESDAKILRFLSRTLKVLSVIIGIPFVAYGLLLGIAGIGITGDAVGFEVRLIGFFLFLQGILYFLPNAKIQKNPRSIIIYLIATISPAVLLLNLTLYEIITDGWVKFVEYGGFKSVGILVPLSLLAPLSLICSMLSLKHS